MVRAGIRLVDAHFHLWDLEENYYPWLSDDRPARTLIKDFSTLRRSYRARDLLRDIGDLNVVGGVHIQAEHDYRDHVRETRWLQRVADDPASRGIPQAIIANADFASPDVEQVLEGHCAFANTRGIRHSLTRHLADAVPYDPLRDPVWVRNFSLLRKHGLSFDMELFPSQADLAIDLIRRNPDVQIVLTHAAMPMWRSPEEKALWKASIARYAEHPNVAIKISGFGVFDPAWNAASIEPIVSQVIAAFTPARCMFATNYPVEGIFKPYRDVWNAYFECLAGYSADEQEAMCWRNATRLYRLEL
jgi:predicted TIM-barrel fold metal-dependent hydrolase